MLLISGLDGQDMLEVTSTADALQSAHLSRSIRCYDSLASQALAYSSNVDQPRDIDRPRDVEMPAVNFRALVVGINKYLPGMTNLDGAVADAEAMAGYLKETLGVPDQNIVLLKNEDATRGRIISELNKFADDDTIQWGDPILFFFSGHGSSAPAPHGWPTAKHRISMLCPSDFQKHSSSLLKGQGLWDVTLSMILGRIAARRGDNITLIFDSCHSGGGAKDNGSGTARFIQLDNDYAIPNEVVKCAVELDQCGDVAQADLRSYVLIAGCKETESSYEDRVQQRGKLTLRLLDALKKAGPNTITYRELMDRIGVIDKSQSPQCEGVHSDRLLFNAAAPGRRPRYYPIFQKPPSKDSKPGEIPPYQMNFGTAAGITKSAKFDVFLGVPTSIDQKPWTRVQAPEVHPFRSTFAVESGYQELPTDIGAAKYDYWARLVQTGEPANLRVSIKPGDVPLSLCNSLINASEGCAKRGKAIVPSDAFPNLIIAPEGQDVSFQVVLRASGINRVINLPHKVQVNSTDEITRICLAVADWLKFLELKNPNPSSDAPPIQIHCYELGRKITELNSICVVQALLPLDPSLDLCTGGVITIQEKNDYGMMLENVEYTRLWASVFFFDADDLTIKPVFLPPYAVHAPHSEKVDPIFSEIENKCMIGYGDSGWPALRFELSSDQDEKIGYLKLLITSTPYGFFEISQESPFATNVSSDDYKTARQSTGIATEDGLSNYYEPRLIDPKNLTDNSIIPIVIKRKAVPFIATRNVDHQ